MKIYDNRYTRKFRLYNETAMIKITPGIAIDEKDISFEFVRSSGPGGQNVNKVSTTVQLRFDLEGASGVPAEVKTRLAGLAGRKLTSDGILVIRAGRFRKQEQNRQDAMERLVLMLRAAAEKPRKRVKTQPSRAAKERKLAEKKRRGRLKQMRKKVIREE